MKSIVLSLSLLFTTISIAQTLRPVSSSAINKHGGLQGYIEHQLNKPGSFSERSAKSEQLNGIARLYYGHDLAFEKEVAKKNIDQNLRTINLVNAKISYTCNARSRFVILEYIHDGQKQYLISLHGGKEMASLKSIKDCENVRKKLNGQLRAKTPFIVKITKEGRTFELEPGNLITSQSRDSGLLKTADGYQEMPSVEKANSAR